MHSPKSTTHWSCGKQYVCCGCFPHDRCGEPEHNFPLPEEDTIDKMIEEILAEFVVTFGKNQYGGTEPLRQDNLKSFLHQSILKAYESGVEIEKEKYNELIMAVGNKCKGETRHETALRYIKAAEMSMGISQEMTNKANKILTP